MPGPICITRPAVRLEKPASARCMKKGVWFEEGEQVAGSISRPVLCRAVSADIDNR